MDGLGNPYCTLYELKDTLHYTNTMDPRYLMFLLDTDIIEMSCNVSVTVILHYIYIYIYIYYK